MISYLITDYRYYGRSSVKISSKLNKIAKKYKFNLACLRDKTNNNYEKLVDDFILTCKNINVKPILHNFIDLAIKHNAFGIHLSSNNFNNIPTAKRNNLFVIASTHSLSEAKQAVSFGADLITVSPIFISPNKSTPMGLEKLKEITDTIPNKCIALGGILEDYHIKDCIMANAIGFASIRYFLK